MRVSFINIHMNDGTRPVAQASVFNDLAARLKVFYAGAFDMKVEINALKNSWLRDRINNLITTTCAYTSIGNGVCDSECKYPITGMDGGDCITNPPSCSAALKGNGVCNRECNTQTHQYDGGDCCSSTSKDVSKSCFDPTSPNVAWLDKNTLQDKVNLKNDNQLNVLFFGFTNPTAGQASMPWGAPGGPLSIRGGAIIDLRQIGGKMFRTLPHELGHSLGLYHTFEDWFGCDDPCFEFTASFGKGDLVEDTSPDYKNGCSPPKAGKCGKKRWSPAPLLTNMMSYHAGCTDLKDQKFTKGQFARMHCYLDLMMSPWTTQQEPSFVPLAPQVMPGSTASSIRLSWIRPMKFTTGKGAGGGECMHCSASGALLQYAIAAKTAGYVQNNPPTDKVLGPPDQKVQCKEGFTALGPLGCHTECPTSRDIFIDVTFEVAVVPAQVTVYLETGSDPVEVVITYTDGSKQDLGVLTGSCSTPPTKTFNAAGKTTKSMRVTFRAISKWTSRGTAIDAVSLISCHQRQSLSELPYNQLSG